ncbi:UvsY [Prochlorococcus phage P-HM2]|uniref:UvsY n=1 Tax=Prochlorococcus phage P-HM2 TaxID=445696 RepID=E3SSX6_9CAUD|nr:UvsY [Prochlorococcus phage P-HM2]ADO99904.1 UvsY [Prochlorococcus phage P-HM2]
MNLETLNDMWEKDSPLDDEKLDHDSLSIPKLHAKYLRLYNNFVTLRDQAELEVKRTYRDRWEYYTGKSEKPFPMKLIKTDVAIYLEADQEYQKSVLKAKYLNQMVEAIKTILSAINNRSFHIKNAVEFAKFLKGYEI